MVAGGSSAIERYESAAQQYIRSAPVLFSRANGAELSDEDGKRYIDFWSGGGTLSYGHNDVRVCRALIEYLCQDQVIQTREKASGAKRDFLNALVETILVPRKLDYKVVFTDPGSGSAAETALRLAQRITGRTGIVAFTGAMHGIAETASGLPRRSAGGQTTFMPYCGYFGPEFDTLGYFRRFLEDVASGLERPAAVIVSSMLDAGGVQIASTPWLQGLAKLCREFMIPLIADETRIGCGRTETFFSFERAGIVPDFVLMPYAMAGGLPLSMTLVRPDLDYWRPGEQTGVFHGDSLSFVAATELLAHWRDPGFADQLTAVSASLEERLTALVARYPSGTLTLQGTGMLWSLDLKRPGAAAVISGWALENGLIVEPAPRSDKALLIVPPITISRDVLEDGVARLGSVLAQFLRRDAPAPRT